jgi:chromosome segregation ATPase
MTAQDGAPQTAAAIQARRAGIAAMIQRVDRALQQMRRDHATVSVAAVSRWAGVSRTFLYQNAEARALVAAAVGEHAKNADARTSAAAPAETAPWRERALNAESDLKRAHGEIAAQRGRIAELLGRIRDLEHDLPEDGIQRTITENHALRAQVRQLTQDNGRLEERLAGARDNNRFLDKRIADLEAQLADGQGPRFFAGTSQTSPSRPGS